MSCSELKLPVLFLCVILLLFDPLAYGQNQRDLVPDWIKNDARWLWDGEITDEEFSNAVGWLVENKILYVQRVETISSSSQQIPQNVKAIVYFWSQDRVSDREFLNSVQYLVSEGIIPLNEHFLSAKMSELQNVLAHDNNVTTVVIIPTFTALAYDQSSFYGYYFGQCDTVCLTTSISKDVPLGFTSSKNGVAALESMGYDTVTDIDVDKNPRILSKYDRVIVLHNEYVTENEFNAITSHTHVIFLYPNALYAKVNVDYNNGTITLARGHGFPDKDIRNGFDWQYDNSPLEYDIRCASWNFYQASNYMMLNCYPEQTILKNTDLLKAIKDL